MSVINCLVEKQIFANITLVMRDVLAIAGMSRIRFLIVRTETPVAVNSLWIFSIEQEALKFGDGIVVSFFHV